MSGFGACRTLLDVSLIHFVVNSLSQLKYILGLADQRARASPLREFGCVVKAKYAIWCICGNIFRIKKRMKICFKSTKFSSFSWQTLTKKTFYKKNVQHQVLLHKKQQAKQIFQLYHIQSRITHINMFPGSTTRRLPTHKPKVKENVLYQS